MTKNLWSKEELDKLTEFKNSGLKNKEIAELLNRPIKSVKSKCTDLRIKGVKLGVASGHIKVSEFDTWSDEELLLSVELYRRAEALDIAARIYNFLPTSYFIKKRFGSWHNALRLAGVPINSDLRSFTGLTKVYLVRFLEEDFYKVGLTRSNIYKRLHKFYPKYEVLDYVELDSYREAKDLETWILKLVSSYSYKPRYFPVPGSTECFKSDIFIDSFDTLLKNIS